MVSKDKLLELLRNAEKKVPEYITWVRNIIYIDIGHLIAKVESGSLDAPPSAEYNKALNDVLGVLNDRGQTREGVIGKIESLRKPSFSEADLQDHPSLKAIESKPEGEESGVE